MDQRKRAGFRGGRKCAGDEFLAEGFADFAVSVRDAALPARQLFRGACEDTPVEIEILVHEGLGDVRSGGVDEMPAKVNLPVSKRDIRHARIQRLKEILLPDIDGSNVGKSQRAEINCPIKMR